MIQISSEFTIYVIIILLLIIIIIIFLIYVLKSSHPKSHPNATGAPKDEDFFSLPWEEFVLEHNRHHASTVDLLIQGEFGWDPEARPWHSGAPMGGPKKRNADWMVNVWMFYMGMGQNQ